MTTLTTLDSVKLFEKSQIIEAVRQAAIVTEAMLDDFVSRQLKPGVTESEMTKTLLELAETRHARVQWHKPYVRFGSNTLLTYRDKSPEDLTFQENDLCFIDFGPVIESAIGRFEGDVGKTWAIGNNTEHAKIAATCEELFFEGCREYREKQLTGMELYAWLEKETEKRGFETNLPDAGHLIGEFPHLRWKSGLANYPEVPEAGCWIFEVQITHSEKPFGAFYENLLE